VLTRAGHTEAGCDLTRLAGLEPAAAIVEILNDDGTMARRPDLEKFAQRHHLKMGTIADLIRYRLDKERSVERIAEQVIATEFGAFRMFCYEDHVNRTVHLALVAGDLEDKRVPLVRVHLKDTLGDVVGIRDHTLGWPLRSAMARIAKEGHGVIVILRPDETPRDLMDAVLNIGREPAAPSPQAGAKVLRTYGIGAQILRDLGVTRMRVLSAPKQMHGLSGFDLEVVEYVDG
jgi:3,4-dihydroxy 2-butanone 4-phosphate synthase / GTP cyclohydrolase II